MGMKLMLYQNKQDNINFHKEYINTFSSKIDSHLVLLNSIENLDFPGAIIPTESNYYICASSQKDWSILIYHPSLSRQLFQNPYSLLICNFTLHIPR